MNEIAKERIAECRHTRAKSLNLNYCEITDLSFITDMTWLTKLDLNSNNILDITPLQSLTDLTTLYIADNQIIDLSPMKNLTGLVEIALGRNKIIDISSLSKLTNLSSLHLSFNKIEIIESLQGLVQLKRLFLAINQITDISVLKILDNLEELSLHENNITDISPLLTLLKKGIPVYWDWNHENRRITLNTNPLDPIIIAKIQQGNDALIKYLEALQTQPQVRINEAKLMIVGEPMAGKTTLRVKLRDTNAAMPTVEARTEGVYIDKETCQFDTLDMDTKTPIPFYYHIWDFGGQKVYKPISQMFITHSTLYVAVINADKGTEQKELLSWFESIEKLTGNSPVIVVQNGLVDPIKTTNLKAIKERFVDMWRGEHTLNLRRMATNIADHDPDSLRRFEILRGRIHSELELLPHRQSTLPESYALVRQAIADKAANGHLLPYTDFEAICTKNGITKPDEQSRLSDTFHILGTYLHYQNNDILKNTIILHSNWATDAAYVVLHSPIVSQKEGHFETLDIQQIWIDATYRGRQKQLVELMKEFRLCYNISQTQTYVVPYCLPLYDAKIADWEIQNNVRLTIKYDFLPSATIVKLLVGLHEYIANGQTWIWQKGGVIDGNSCHAYSTYARIEQDEDNRQLTIKVHGKMTLTLFSIILKELDTVNKPYPALDIKKRVLCNCAECQKDANPEYYDYETHLIRRLYTNENATIECHKSSLSINISDLLRGVISPEQVKRDAIELIMKDKNNRYYKETPKTALEQAADLLAKSDAKKAIALLIDYFKTTNNTDVFLFKILRGTNPH